MNWVSSLWIQSKNAWKKDIEGTDRYSNIYSLLFGAYALLQYRYSGIEIILLPLVLSRINRLWEVTKEVQFIAIAGTSVMVSAIFNDNWGPASKIVIMMLFSYLYFTENRINFIALCLGALISTILLHLFSPDLLYSSEGVPFWLYASNYSVYIFCGSLICSNYGVLFALPLAVIVLSRWMIVSIVFSLFTRKIAIFIVALAYIKLFVFTTDTYGFELKQISEASRLEQHQIFYDNSPRMFLGIPYRELIDSLQTRTGTDIDSFESIVLNRIALFGIFSIPLLYMHLRLLILGGNKRIFMFLFPLFNPLDFSLFYFLFYYSVIESNDEFKEVIN